MVSGETGGGIDAELWMIVLISPRAIYIYRGTLLGEQATLEIAGGDYNPNYYIWSYLNIL